MAPRRVLRRRSALSSVLLGRIAPNRALRQCLVPLAHSAIASDSRMPHVQGGVARASTVRAAASPPLPTRAALARTVRQAAARRSEQRLARTWSTATRHTQARSSRVQSGRSVAAMAQQSSVLVAHLATRLRSQRASAPVNALTATIARVAARAPHRSLVAAPRCSVPAARQHLVVYLTASTVSVHSHYQVATNETKTQRLGPLSDAVSRGTSARLAYAHHAQLARLATRRGSQHLRAAEPVRQGSIVLSAASAPLRSSAARATGFALQAPCCQCAHREDTVQSVAAARSLVQRSDQHSLASLHGAARATHVLEERSVPRCSRPTRCARVRAHAGSTVHLEARALSRTSAAVQRRTALKAPQRRYRSSAGTTPRRKTASCVRRGRTAMSQRRQSTALSTS